MNWDELVGEMDTASDTFVWGQVAEHVDDVTNQLGYMGKPTLPKTDYEGRMFKVEHSREDTMPAVIIRRCHGGGWSAQLEGGKNRIHHSTWHLGELLEQLLVDYLGVCERHANRNALRYNIIAEDLGYNKTSPFKTEAQS